MRTDVAVAAFRTLLFLPGIVSVERSGVWSRRFEPKKWIPRFRIMQTCGFIFFSVFALIMFLFPPAPAGSPTYDVYLPYTDVAILTVPIESLIPVAIIFCTFVSTGFFSQFANILTQRQLLDVIPNRIRNSMYSLQPTISTLLAIPQILVFGWIIADFSFSVALAGVGMISLFGALMIRHGLSYPKPVVEDETWSVSETIDESVIDDQERVERLSSSEVEE